MGLVVLSFKSVVKGSSGVLADESQGVEVSHDEGVVESVSFSEAPERRNSDNDVLEDSFSLLGSQTFDMSEDHTEKLFDF